MYPQDKTNPWLPVLPAQSDAIRLFCLPYAGAGASVFRSWSGLFNGNTGIYPVQLPGRENRIDDPPCQTMEELLNGLCEALRPYLQRPFVLFGHSIGARIAFELTRKIRQHWDLRPRHLIVSGSRAPHIPEPKPLHNLPDDAFVRELRRFSGTPEQVLRNKELMELFIPILRADFRVDETYRHLHETPLDCPITAFGGTQDGEASRTEIAAWATHTRADFKLEMIAGDHFFLHSQRDALVRSIARILSQHVAVIGGQPSRQGAGAEHTSVARKKM